MKRWFALALGLAVVAVGVALLVSRTPSDKRRQAVEPVWPSVTVDSVREISISAPAGRYVLTREDKVWYVRPGEASLPAKAKADPAKVSALLDLLSLNKPIRALPSAERRDDAALGLDRPRIRISVTLESKDQALSLVELSLGRTIPSGEGLYAVNSMNPGTVFLLAKAWERQLDHQSEYYCDTRIFSAPEDKISRLRSLGAAGPDWEVARKDGGFVFLLPEAAKDKPVAESEVKLLIHNLTGLRARLLPDGTRTVGEPWLRYELWSGGAVPEFLEIFGQEPLPGMILARSSWQPGLVALDRDVLDQLAKSGFDLEGRKVLSLDTGKVQFFRIVLGGQLLNMEKTQDGWLDSSTGKALRGIDMALWRLSDVKFEAAAVPALPPSADEAMTCEARDKSGASLVLLRFYTDIGLSPGLCWLRVEGSPLCYPVSAQLFKDLQGLFPLKK
ncbi:DUF4340 domain-containing protein [Desulfovibrio aminophilus]|uniref:DUF4340 domain-containing protein n=1 Tax=Desulfovibrio aminophilus TaxID=81425 RepID=UPI003391B59F